MTEDEFKSAVAELIRLLEDEDENNVLSRLVLDEIAVIKEELGLE